MRALAFSIVVAFLALPAPAQESARAMPRCGAVQAMRDALSEAFGEERRFAGLVDGRGVVELFVGPSSWSLTLTTPDGQTCLIAAGYDFFMIPAGDPA